MQLFNHHAIFNEITYNREELKDWYKSVEKYKNDYSIVTNRNKSIGLSHNKKFRYGLFDTLDTEEQAGISVIDYEPVKKLVNKFNFNPPLQPCDVDVLIYQPGFFFHPHVDFHMKCGVMFPILPDVGAAPIDFYKLPPNAVWERATGYSKWIRFERDLLYSYYYSNKHPSLFNGETIHGVRNNDKTRIFLRFKSVFMSFNDIVQQTKKGTFIKN